AHSSDQVQEVGVWPFQPRRRSIDQWFGCQRQPEVRHAPPGQLRSEKSWCSHADHGEGVSIDLVASTDYRRIRSVLVVPYAVTHHSDGRRTLLIVLVGEQPANPRLHAKGPEKIPGYVLPIACVH